MKLPKKFVDVALLVCCARCGRNHRAVKFMRLTRLQPDAEWTHYSVCPRTAQPILMKLVAVVVLAALLAGCDTAAQDALHRARGHAHRITLYSGGVPVRSWISVGEPSGFTGGCYFCDVESGELVTVKGETVVEACPE